MGQSNQTNKLTGNDNNYYLVTVNNPKRGVNAYQAEAEDIIEALNMTFAEGCIFKSIWRSCAQRLGNGKPGADEDGIYDAEKMVYYSKRTLAKRISNKQTNSIAATVTAPFVSTPEKTYYSHLPVAVDIGEK